MLVRVSPLISQHDLVPFFHRGLVEQKHVEMGSRRLFRKTQQGHGQQRQVRTCHGIPEKKDGGKRDHRECYYHSKAVLRKGNSYYGSAWRGQEVTDQSGEELGVGKGRGMPAAADREPAGIGKTLQKHPCGNESDNRVDLAA